MSNHQDLERFDKNCCIIGINKVSNSCCRWMPYNTPGQQLCLSSRSYKCLKVIEKGMNLASLPSSQERNHTFQHFEFQKTKQTNNPFRNANIPGISRVACNALSQMPCWDRHRLQGCPIETHVGTPKDRHAVGYGILLTSQAWIKTVLSSLADAFHEPLRVFRHSRWPKT